MFKKLTILLITLATLSGCFKPTESDLGEEVLIKQSMSSKARIKTVYGDIILRFSKEAPSTAQRVQELIKSGFYNGLLFHRVSKNNFIQTGDPTGTGEGGTGTKIKSEINSNSHTLGAVSMAIDENDSNSADSQFFICLKELPELDEKYTVFAYVESGIDIAKKIRKNDKIILLTLED